MAADASLPYHEPDIKTILILASFLLLLNIVNWGLDRLIYCGLIGQILIGVAWGTPGSTWLSPSVEETVVALGYIGLILLVYEGGLSTNLLTLRANLFLSATVALTGIAVPIGLSFVLQEMASATALQAFAAGAALCSTSLGTTFTVLATSGLTESRLGVVLSSAAMMDDVVGLVMVKVISNLGPQSDFDAVTVVRPVLVSIAFAVVVPLLCRWIVKPLTVRYMVPDTSDGKVNRVGFLTSDKSLFVVHTAVLLAMLTGSTYAGTSNLFAAYLAGAAVTWWSRLLETGNEGATNPKQPSSEKLQREDAVTAQGDTSPPSNGDGITTTPPASASADVSGAADDIKKSESQLPSSYASGLAVFEKYYAPALQFILKPFFFASIGFSIPITEMFSGAVVWRGVVYAILMTFAKLLCGACLIRISGLPDFSKAIRRIVRSGMSGCWPFSTSKRRVDKGSAQPSENNADRTGSSTAANASSTGSLKPLSLYPAAILGSAMVARGEIGFLISAVAESKGIFQQEGASNGAELFLIVTWAILLCTIIGPIVVGVLVRRVKTLQQAERSKRTGHEDPLGIWGVLPGEGSETGVSAAAGSSR